MFCVLIRIASSSIMPMVARGGGGGEGIKRTLPGALTSNEFPSEGITNSF